MQMVFTRILSGAYSLASDLVRLMPAARETLVGSPRACGTFAPRLVTLMMRPPPRFFMWGMQSRQSRMAEKTLRSKSCCQPTSSTRSNEAAAEVPALLTRMSTPPQSRTTSSTKAPIWSAFVTSTDLANTWPPALRMPSAVFASTSARREQIATRAPSAARRCAAARPSPSLPPVMMATLSFSPRSSIRVSSPWRVRRNQARRGPPQVRCPRVAEHYPTHFISWLRPEPGAILKLLYSSEGSPHEPTTRLWHLPQAAPDHGAGDADPAGRHLVSRLPDGIRASVEPDRAAARRSGRHHGRLRRRLGGHAPPYAAAERRPGGHGVDGRQAAEAAPPGHRRRVQVG